jgi:hypothetical protein
MAREIARGDIGLYVIRPPDENCPVVVLSRQDVIPLLNALRGDREGTEGPLTRL